MGVATQFQIIPKDTLYMDACGSLWARLFFFKKKEKVRESGFIGKKTLKPWIEKLMGIFHKINR